MGDDSVPELGGGRPPLLGDPPGPQARVHRHTVEQMIKSFEPVPMLDLDAPEPQPVIEVPKISLQGGFPRAVLREPQLDVPVPSPSNAHLGRPWCWHGIGTQMAANGAAALDQGGRGATDGSRVHDTPSGFSRRGSPPAHCGIYLYIFILGAAPVPQVAVLLGTPVVDVPVTMLLEFQQSLPIESEMVPQIQFIARLLNFQLCHREEYAQCKLCRKPEIPQCSFLSEVVDAPVVVQRPVPGSAEIVWRWSTLL